MATSLAAMAALKSEGVDVTAADFVAGHSLGEYSALCAVGAITLADTARLLRIRGEAMQKAVPVGVGAMAALLGLDFAAATFTGSAGIGKLLLFYKNVASHGGQVTINNMSKDIYTMFKVVKLDKIFNMSSAG